MAIWDSTTATWDDAVETWGTSTSLFQLGTAKVELLLAGVWTDITTYVKYAEGIKITRGRSSEASDVERSTCQLTLKNGDGRFSPRNPAGAYFGLIGRNTQLRASVSLGKTRMLAPAGGTDYASTADAAAISVTGDIDLRVDASLRSWRDASALISKWSTGQQAYRLRVDDDGMLNLEWTTDGSTTITATSTLPVPLPSSGRRAVRATLDVDNGASGYDVTFYTSESLSGSWTALGDVVTGGSTTSIFNSTSDLTVSSDQDGAVFYAAKVLSGIGGTEVANPDFEDVVDGSVTFSDPSGLTWTAYGDAEFTSRYTRFVGEVSTWPQKWDPTGTDVTVDIEASGIMRRLSQGTTPVKSTLRRGLTTLSTLPVAYWPHEDLAGSQTVASGLPGGLPMRLSRGTPSFGNSTAFACSAALPTMNDAEWNASIPDHTYTAKTQVRFLLGVPTDGIGTAGDETILTVYTTSSMAEAAVVVTLLGELRLVFRDRDGTLLLDTGALTTFEANGNLLRVSLEMQQSGGNVAWALRTLNAVTREYLVETGLVLGYTLGRASNILINPGGGPGDVVFGHLSVENQINSLLDLSDELTGYAGEAAGRRAERICSEEGIAFQGIGDLDDTVAMGAQTPDDLLTLLRETAQADFGILFEPRDELGFAFRTRESMQLQEPALELSYTSADLSEIEPVDDDRYTRNDITVTRKNGSSYPKVQDDGPLGVDTVGRYDDSVTVNVETDDMLQDQAGWRLYLGTLDEARYPTLGVQLARPVFDEDLMTSTLRMDLGDRLDVLDPPSWLPPDDITQLVQGVSESFDNFQMAVTWNCTPQSLWGTLAVYDDTEVRYMTDGSTVVPALNNSQTSFSVSTPTGPVWSHADGNFNIKVDGEIMTVTGISGTGATQTFTVTRGAAGSTAATHLAGAEISLSPIRVYGI